MLHLVRTWPFRQSVYDGHVDEEAGKMHQATAAI